MKAAGRRQKAEGKALWAARRKTRVLLSALFFLPSTFCLLPSAFSQSPSPRPAATPAAVGFEGYKLVRTRNVFDPDLRPLVTASQGTPAPAPIQQSDYIALTGTMLNAGKTLAFFSGSRPEFNKVLSVRDSIAKATITNISVAGVEVDRGGYKITVAVGQTLPLDNSAPTAAPAPQPVVAAAAAAAAATVVSTTATVGGTAATPAANAGAMSAKQQEIMKRMMEKRKQDGLQ